jgi:hypothetical protein
MLELFAFPQIEDFESENKPALVFQYDGAPLYFCHNVRHAVSARFPNRRTGKTTNI